MSQKVDVIIPMYNRENCVANIIAELGKQTFKEFRAIFVDDGSTDNTYEILIKELAAVSFDYKVIKKENGGAGSARNAGMRIADAQWIAFVDSDDRFHSEYLEYMYKAVNDSKSDLGICGYQMLVEGKQSNIDNVGEFKYKTITPADAMVHYCDGWLGVYCLMISRDMQQKKNLFFNEDCCYCEDAPFITEVIEAAESVSLIEYNLYLYCISQGSLSRSGTLNKFFSAISAFAKMEEKMLKSSSEAAKVFNLYGSVRYYVATLRKAAVQMSYKDFLVLAKKVNFRSYKNQITYLKGTLKIASGIFLISKFLFYCVVNILFKD